MTIRQLGCLVAGALLCACGSDSGGTNNDNQNNNQVAVCGNGVVEAGEECDNGAANDDATPDACRTDCRDAFCGDGTADTGEACDDGNAANDDGCLTACAGGNDCCVANVCGDGFVDATDAGGGDQVEACDDGNTVDDNECRGDCGQDMTLCGNAILDQGEGCDGGGLNSDTAPDACRTGCQPAGCGDGVMDAGEECDTGANNGQSPELCRADCVLTVCGDAYLGGLEVCDDGNTDPGDGCSADCLSDETCGNGIVDPGAGEQCDDGNTATGDGCSATCQDETPVWTDLGIPSIDSPSLRESHAMAYDSARDRVVLFGGQDGGSILGDTWEFDGAAWVGVVVPNPVPGARTHAAMAYDASRQVVVMFGGLASGVPSDETWEYDGTAWTSVATASIPVARQRHGLVFDSLRNRVVLFGGADSGVTPNPFDDLWSYDGTDWTQIFGGGVVTPPLRYDHGMVYDASQDRVLVLYGHDGMNAVDDAYAFDGTDWATHPVMAGQPRRSLMAAYYASGGQTIVFGGIDDGANYQGDTLRIIDQSLDTWVLTPSPSNRTTAGMVFDSMRGRIVLFGGFDGLPGYLNDTWVFTYQ